MPCFPKKRFWIGKLKRHLPTKSGPADFVALFLAIGIPGHLISPNISVQVSICLNGIQIERRKLSLTERHRKCLIFIALLTSTIQSLLGTPRLNHFPHTVLPEISPPLGHFHSRHLPRLRLSHIDLLRLRSNAGVPMSLFPQNAPGGALSD